jgi:multidrug resistance efflux pump
MAIRIGTKEVPVNALVISVLFLPVFGWAVWYGFLELRNRPIVVTGTIQAKEIPVASKVGGRLCKVLVQEGQMVAAGQVLVEFDVPELEARRKQLCAQVSQDEAQLLELKNGPRLAEIGKAKAAEMQLLANWQMLQNGYRQEDVNKARSLRKEAERNLALLVTGYRKEEITQSQELMEQAKAHLDFAEKDFARYKLLASQGAVSTRDADDADTKMASARDLYQAAQANYQKMKAGPRLDEIRAARERLNVASAQESMMVRGPRPEEIEMAKQQYLQAKHGRILLEQGTRYEQINRAEAKLQQAKAVLSELDAQLKDKTVVAPCNAEVSVMDLHAGEIIPANKTVATLTRLDTIWTRVYLPERELARVRIGQEVTVKVDAYRKRSFKGKIVQIPGVAEFTPRNVQTPEERSAQVFGLKINIDNAEFILRGGMNAEVTLPPVEGPWTTLARSRL